MKYKYTKIPYSSTTRTYRCEKCSIDYWSLLGKLDISGELDTLYSVKTDDIKRIEIVCGYCVEKLENDDCDWALGFYSMRQELSRIRGLQASKVILDEI